MSPTIEKILLEALSLPEDARLDLATALLESVDRDPPDEGAEEAWSAEAKRRLDEVRSGAVKPVPWEEAEKLIFDPSDGPKGR
jgi:putative addiction module component (TIGR02574 family)